MNVSVIENYSRNLLCQDRYFLNRFLNAWEIKYTLSLLDNDISEEFHKKYFKTKQETEWANQNRMSV